MANTILLKKNSTAGTAPTAGQLSAGELAINTADGRLFAKNEAGTVVNLPVTSISGQSVSPSKLAVSAANSATAGEAQIYLNGATGNRIDFNSNGVAAPTLVSRSVGTKICLYPSHDANGLTDYAIGISTSTFWQSVPAAYTVEEQTVYEFAWYGGASKLASLDNAGNFSAAGVTATNLFSQYLLAKANVYDATEIGTYTFYNTNVLDVDEVGAVAKITGSTGNSPTEGFLLFSAAASGNNGYAAILQDTFGVHPAGVVVDPTGTSTRTNPLVALDVRGSATVTGGIVASGNAQTPGIRSPQTDLYLWQNFR
jgi:hypothetical protein